MNSGCYSPFLFLSGKPSSCIPFKECSRPISRQYIKYREAHFYSDLDAYNIAYFSDRHFAIKQDKAKNKTIYEDGKKRTQKYAQK